MKAFAGIGLLVVVLGAQGALPSNPAPIASVRYRGQPAGVPRAEDLAEIRAAGFSALTWPAGDPAGIEGLRRLADKAGLAVVIESDSTPLTLALALKQQAFVDVRANDVRPETIAPMVWRAIAHGARVVSFNPRRREGTGLLDTSQHRPGWAAPAAEIARQLRVNGTLFGQCQAGPAVTVDDRDRAGLDVTLDVTLLEARKSWVLVATNGSNVRARAMVHLPAGIPYALWLNLLDGSTMAMLDQSTGPQWSLDIERWGLRIYVIDKTLK